MLPLSPPPGRADLNQGMTLVEVLVVLLIMGLLVSVTAVSTGIVGGSSRGDSSEVSSLGHDISQAFEQRRQQALAENEVLGWSLDEHQRSIWWRWQSGSWLQIDESAMKVITLPDTVEMQITSSAFSADQVPTVVFFPGLEMTAFEINLRSKGVERAAARVWSAADGSMQWSVL